MAYWGHDVSWGRLGIRVDGEGRVVRVDIEAARADLPDAPGWLAAPLDDYLLGRKRAVDLPWVLPARIRGFQRRALLSLPEIPYGTALSYAEVARKVDSPRAWRAVGNACSRNPLPLILPCHRVVGSTGPGGFAVALGIKLHLLELEGFVKPKRWVLAQLKG